MEGADAAALSCPGCGASFAVGALDPDVRWLCGRCDHALAGPPRTSFDTLRSRPVVRWLYARKGPGAPVHEGPARRIGRYTLRSELGRGGMGVVYRAWDADLAREVALKVLLTGEHSAQDHVERFLREARAAAKLDHPNLVRVLDIGWADDRVYFTMDLVDGPSLQDVLVARRRMPAAEALRIGAALGRALHAAHRRGLVHRDVKPGNVLLRPDGTPMLADFGLATELVSQDARLTKTGQVMGTPAYMAPEQTGSRALVGPLTDQYSLGAVLYELVTGTPPYLDESAVEVLYALIAGPPQGVRERAPDVPRDVALLVETAMAREPHRRYPDTEEFAEDLERWLRGEPIRARPPSLLYRARRAMVRRRRVLLLGATALAGALVAGEAVSVGRSWADRGAEREHEARASRDLDGVQARAAELRDQGQRSEARALLTAFAGEGAHRGTSASVRALVDAAGLVDEDQLEEAIDLWAQAYASARTGADQELALRGLASRFRAAWRWEALSNVLDTLVEHSPALASDPEVASWRAEALLAARRPAEAGPILASAAWDVRPIVEALSRGTPAPTLEGALGSADLDGDGVDEWWIVPEGAREVRVVEVAPRFPGLRRLAFPADREPPEQVIPLGGDPVLVLAHHPEDAVLYEVDGDALREVAAWPESKLGDAVAADLDRDGIRELWVGVGPYARKLLRLDPGADGRWIRSQPDPQIDALNSDVMSLAVADLDGDGRDELALAAGAWSAYDVRLLRAEGRRAGTVARLKLGFVHAMTVVDGPRDRLWVVESDQYPTRVVFPPERPYGADPGAWLLELDDHGQLVTRAHLPRPGPRQSGGGAAVGGMVVADIDGDGVDEVVLDVSGTTVVYPGGSASVAPVLLGGAVPIVAAQLDGDPADELVVAVDGGTTWVLGVGEEALPPIERPATARARVPDLPDADPVRLRTWSRAEDLVAMGLVERAVDELERLGDAWDEPDAAARVRRRAAGLLESLGDDERAARLWAAAGDPEARAAAARADIRGHRYDHALALLRTLQTDEAAAEIAKLAPVVERTRTETLSFAGGPAPFEVRDPVAVRNDAASGGLRVVALAGDQEMLRLPFRWSGERLAVRVELDLQRLEWGAGLRVMLRGPADEIGVAVRGWGGGNVLEREVVCLLPDVEGRRTPVSGPAVAERLVLELDVSAVTRDARCTLSEGSAPAFVATFPLDRMPVAGEWELVIDPSPHGGVGGPAAAVAVLREIDLTGTRLELGGTPGSRPDPASMAVWAAVALADGVRFEEAVAAVKALPRPVDDKVAHALRSRLTTFGPVVREALGDAYWSAFQRGWDIAMSAHPDDDEVRRALTVGLSGLSRVQRGTGDLATRQRVTLLMVARGRAWAGLGEPAAAKQDITEASERLVPLLATLPPDEARDARQRLATAWIDLAEVLAGGDPAGARAAVDRALEVAAAPEIVIDQVRARPALVAIAATFAR